MRALLSLALAAAAAGCTALPEPADHEPDLFVPPDWTAVGAHDRGGVDRFWWRAFGDPRLEELIDEAVRHNRELRGAAARLAAAEAQARIAGAERLPTVDLSASRNRLRQNFVGLPVPGGGDVLQSTATQYGVSLDVTWELDLWGRLRAGREAALEDEDAARADLRGAHLSIAAQTAKGWFALIEARQQLELAQETVANYTTNAALVRNRYERGRGSSLDVRLLESSLASARGLEAARRVQHDRAVRQLEILLGRYPAARMEAPDELPVLGAAALAGVPSGVLRRRPDVVAAEARLRAADLRLYRARAELWPAFRLTAATGRATAELGDLVDPDFDVWSLFTGLTQPIFRGGSLRAAVDLNEARVAEALAGFGDVALRAFAEVEQGLAAEAILERREGHLERAAREARAALELARERYGSGVVDVLIVLESQRRWRTSESGLLQIRLERVLNRVDLYLSLGGGFDEPADESAPSAEDAGRESSEEIRP